VPGFSFGERIEAWWLDIRQKRFVQGDICSIALIGDERGT
jgi:hypothetical protein